MKKILIIKIKIKMNGVMRKEKREASVKMNRVTNSDDTMVKVIGNSGENAKRYCRSLQV